MSNILVEADSLFAIADAIRSKTGSSDTYKPAEMAGAIHALAGPAVYGVMWDMDDPGTALTRLTPENDPFHLVNTYVRAEPIPAVGEEMMGCSPFDGVMPWAGMRERNIVNGQVAHWKGEEGFSRVDPTEDEAGHHTEDWDTMVYIPAFYMAVRDVPSEVEGEYGKRCYYVADGPAPGFIRHPGSDAYVGRYISSRKYIPLVENPTVQSDLTNAGSSLPGKRPHASFRIAGWRTDVSAKGEGWSIETMQIRFAYALLYLVEFADWDSMAKIGPGLPKGAMQSTGGTDGMVYHTGAADEGDAAVCYRGIENPWGNCGEVLEGALYKLSSGGLVIRDEPPYASVTTTYTPTNILCPGIGTRIRMLAKNDDFPWLTFVPTEAADEGYIPAVCTSETRTAVKLVASGCIAARASGAYETRGLFFFYGSITTATSGMTDGVGYRVAFRAPRED